MRILFRQANSKHYYRYACTLFIAFTINGCAGPEPRSTTASEDSKSEVTTQKTTSSRNISKSNPTGTKVVTLAQGVLGSPYKYGGSSPRGFDCSGLVYYTHNKLGISVPRTTRDQAKHANTLRLSDVEPGDILFFKIYGNRISHVGIYTGNNQFIHAPKSGKYVSYASIDDPFWRQRLVKAGRLH